MKIKIKVYQIDLTEEELDEPINFYEKIGKAPKVKSESTKSNPDDAQSKVRYK